MGWIPDLKGLFLIHIQKDLAAYSIISENNAGQYYPDYGYNHPLFTDKMRIYSDSKVADFITGITPDQSVGFLNEWNARRDHREKIYSKRLNIWYLAFCSSGSYNGSR